MCQRPCFIFCSGSRPTPRSRLAGYRTRSEDVKLSPTPSFPGDIPAQDFPEHVRRQGKDSNYGFAEEYQVCEARGPHPAHSHGSPGPPPGRLALTMRGTRPSPLAWCPLQLPQGKGGGELGVLEGKWSQQPLPPLSNWLWRAKACLSWRPPLPRTSPRTATGTCCLVSWPHALS